MRAGAWRAAVVAVALSFLVAACNPFARTYIYRYRITVEVDTPQGLRTGSSVWETSAWQGSGIPDNAIRSRVRGKAVAVDLPGGTLLALLRGQDMDLDYAVGLVSSALKEHPLPGVTTTDDWKSNRELIASKKPTVDLPLSLYPLLVRFRDINNPGSVEKVDPNDLAASFGPGVRLRRVTVAVTNDEVEIGSIYDRLRWLQGWGGQLLPAGNTPVAEQTFPSRIFDGDFVRKH